MGREAEGKDIIWSQEASKKSSNKQTRRIADRKVGRHASGQTLKKASNHAGKKASRGDMPAIK